MITGAEVMGLLGEACPSWSAIHPASADRASLGGRDYEQMGEFAHHVVDLAERGETDEFPAVFATTDRILTTGDADAVSLIRTGLIEDLQNITSHRDVSVGPDDLRPLLPPAATAVWDELDEAWSAATAFPESGHRSPAEAYLHLGPTDRRRVQSMTRELPDGTLAAPSDVLRYEAVQYDEELGRWLRFVRFSPWVYGLLAVLLLWGLFLLVRG